MVQPGPCGCLIFWQRFLPAAPVHRHRPRANISPVLAPGIIAQVGPVHSIFYASRSSGTARRGAILAKLMGDALPPAAGPLSTGMPFAGRRAPSVVQVMCGALAYLMGVPNDASTH